MVCLYYFVSMDLIAGDFFSPGILAISNLSLGLNRVAVASIPILVVSKFCWSLDGSKLDPLVFGIITKPLSAWHLVQTAYSTATGSTGSMSSSTTVAILREG